MTPMCNGTRERLLLLLLLLVQMLHWTLLQL
jgi:hypothetical protein